MFNFYLGIFFPAAGKIHSQPSSFPDHVSDGPKKIAKTTGKRQALPSQVRAEIILKSGKGYLNTLAEQATKTAHWICRFCWADGQRRAQSCVLRLQYPAARKAGCRLVCTDTDTSIKQTIKIIDSSFNTGQMSRYNGFLKMQNRFSVDA